MKLTYKQLGDKFNELFDRFNPKFPKSTAAPGFKEAWKAALAEAGWTKAEWDDELTNNEPSFMGAGPFIRAQQKKD